jgi:hypothetical protein
LVPSEGGILKGVGGICSCLHCGEGCTAVATAQSASVLHHLVILHQPHLRAVFKTTLTDNFSSYQTAKILKLGQHIQLAQCWGTLQFMTPPPNLDPCLSIPVTAHSSMLVNFYFNFSFSSCLWPFQTAEI